MTGPFVDIAVSVVSLTVTSTGAFLVRSAFKITKRLDSQDTAIASIRSEVKPNGGSSLKDAVVRIETKLGDHLEQSSRDLARVDRYMERNNTHEH